MLSSEIEQQNVLHDIYISEQGKYKDKMVYSSSNSILQNLQMHLTLTIALSLTRRMIVYTWQETCYRECQVGEKEIVYKNLYNKYFDEVS